MWAKKEPAARNLITPATSDLWQVGLTVFEMFSRRRLGDVPYMGVLKDYAKAVLQCVTRTPKDVLLAMSPTEAEDWLVNDREFAQGIGLSQKMVDGPRMLDLAYGEMKAVKRVLGLKPGSAGKFQSLIRRSVSSVADTVPQSHNVTDVDGSCRHCGIGLLLTQSLHADVTQRPSSSWAALQIIGAKQIGANAKLDSFDFSSANGFQVIPASVLRPAEDHEDDDIESTYEGLVSLFENANNVRSAITSCANWLAMVSPYNASARDRALGVYCDLLRRHADIVEDICLAPPSAHWHVENFDATCFERIASAMWFNFRPPPNLASIDLSQLCLINTNVLEMLLCAPTQCSMSSYNPMSATDDNDDNGARHFWGDGISSLTTLNLEGCRVQGMIPRAGLAGCPRLRELDLGGCNFTDPALDKVMAALQPASKSLVKLNLGGSKIGGSIPAAVDMAHFTVLSELRLYAMGLSGMSSCDNRCVGERHRHLPVGLSLTPLLRSNGFGGI
jgi:hypothetical protein